jgi:hypothetical protein
MFDKYCTYIESCLSKGDISSFKTGDDYLEILEHVTYKQGYDYLQCILKHSKLTLTDVADYCKLNDSVGNPKLFSYPRVRCSPTSLRYLYHAHLALTHFMTFGEPMDFVEIGGGYGGLALAVDYLAKKYGLLDTIKSYTIIDLTAPGKLQKEVLSKHAMSIPMKYVNAETYGKDIETSKLFLISNYAFSSFSEPIRSNYQRHLFPKVAHGCMVWNLNPTYDFGFPCRIEDEVPMTTSTWTNHYVYF